MEIHSYEIEGIPVSTGDILCTTDGGDSLIAGQFWKLIGKLIPGDVDHIVVYLGPEGRCAESGPLGCITFNVPSHLWDAGAMNAQRGGFLDRFYGVVYPLKESNLPEEEEHRIRRSVGEYCLTQAEAHKPYNFAFPLSDIDEAFYCSQLAYKAYRLHGINLNTGEMIPNIPGTDSIIYPQEIWAGFPHAKPS